MKKYNRFVLYCAKNIAHLASLFLLLCSISMTRGQSHGEFFCNTFSDSHKELEGTVDWQQYEYDYETFVQSHGSKSTSRMNLVLPVVFHVIHENGSENISDQTIQRGLDFLNDAFANTGYYDRGTGVATNIQFCLAKQDEFGEATTGITRTQSPLTEIVTDQDDLDLKSLIKWNALDYINIYVVKEICQAGNCGVAGYAFFPTAHGQLVDGIVFEARFMGENEADNAVLVHEVGHYLGLYHTFQGGCGNNDCLSQGDRVCDTPPDQTTLPARCDLPPNSCTTDEDDTSLNNPFRPINSGGQGDQDDMHINYMDYGDLGCYSAFTQGQADRMEFALLGARASLLQSTACDDPCPNPVSAEINQGDMIVNVGDNVELTGVAENASSVYWTINTEIASMTSALIETFETKGWYEVVFFAETDDVLCLPKSDTILIQVICPVNASFTPLPDECIDLGLSITFQNNSTGENNVEFFYDGISQSTGSSATIYFNQGGRFEIMLVAYGATCHDTLRYIVSVGCDEICDNGYDDDDDDLVDQYDPDCCTPQSDFFFLCEEYCEELSGFPYDIQVEWSTQDSTEKSLTMPVAGDIDGDGIVEVVFVNDQLDISIANGQNGRVERIIPTWRLNPILAIADLTNDGFGEIIAIQFSSQRIVAYRYDGSLLFQSNVGVDLFSNDKDTYISVADFDQDGWPEIYVGNQIFNGQTGEEIVSGGTALSRGEPYQLDPYFWQKMASVAADILPDEHCPDCDGLELIAGNQVMTVNLANRLIRVQEEINGEQDGITAVVDFDQDGDLDVVVTNKWNISATSDRNQHKIYIWDGQTSQLIDEYEGGFSFNKGRLGNLTVGNFDADSDLEMACVIGYEFKVFDHDLTQLYERNLSEPTCVNLISFDFDLDGILELVIRDGEDLQIFDGTSGAVLYSYPLASATRVESPIILDVDGDNQAEIVVDGNDRIYCFGIPDTEKWANARPVYNQMQFFNVNINNDLSVPPQQQLHNIVGDKKILNSFLNPVAFLPPQPDLTAEAQQLMCMGDSVLLTYEICNDSDIDVLSDISTTIYCGDPSSSTSIALKTVLFSGGLLADMCFINSVKVESDCGSEYFIVTNDDGSLLPPFDLLMDFPITAIVECEFENNIDTFINDVNFYSLDLGPDLYFCYSAINLNASDKYVTYLWDDGSVDSVRTIFGPGEYFVEIVDSCGGLQYDTIQIHELITPVLDLGPDTTICEFGIVTLNAGVGFSSYAWTGGQMDSTLTVFQSGIYGVTVVDGCGNALTDEVEVTMGNASTFDLGPDASICVGDSFFIAVPGFRPYRWGPRDVISCDTCASTYLKPTTETTYTVLAIDSNGCVVSDSITILVDTLVCSLDTFELCLGDSIYLNGNWISIPGDYEFMGQAAGGCDSLSKINISSYSLSLIQMADTLVEQGALLNLWIESAESQLVEYEWSPSSVLNCMTCPSPSLNPQENIFVYVSVVDENNCSGNDTIYIQVTTPTGYYIPTAFSPNNDQINDHFLVYSEVNSSATYDIEIFNRWGGKMFERRAVDVNDVRHGWDGTFNQKAVENGIYTYVIHINTEMHRAPFAGSIHLIR